MSNFEQRNTVLIWSGEGEIVQIEPWGTNSLRVRVTQSAAIRDDLPGALLDPAPTDVVIAIGEEAATLQNGAITAQISAKGLIRFTRTDTGEELLAEAPVHFVWPGARHFKGLPGDMFKVEAHFAAYEGERFYGMGQYQHGRLDQKGCALDLMQRNTQVTIPFLVSSRGYGFLWHNPAAGRAELAENGTCWVAEATPQIDYWITAGDSYAAIMEQYADATGHAPPFPDWAAGFWQCKLRYRTQEELLEVAREHQRRGLPLSIIVSDFFNWSLMGDWQFDPDLWPDPSAMTRELNEMGVKLMVSIWPTVNMLSPNFKTMQQRGLLVRNELSIPAQLTLRDNAPEGPIHVQYYDATNPEARAFIWEKAREGYYQHGVKVWWLDVCEPEMYPMYPENLRYHIGNGLAVTNIYPLLHTQAFYDGMRAEGETEIIHLCRSAWAGSQRYGAAVWSGDIPSTFASLRQQVRAGLNIALSGIPWWTTDIGGFHDGDPESPSFRELIVRWFQYGVFCPLFRLHGFRHPIQSGMTSKDLTGGPNEVWSFGDEAYEIIKECLFLRERLRPYVMDQMQMAHEHGLPPMRPLFFDFPDDEACIAVDDEFLFGSALLVAPVLDEGVRSRDVYLPAGATWTDAWTGDTYAGGQQITVDAPLDRIPLYLRDGAELPIT